ncbi:protein BatD [Vibrio aquaticus]|uniref:Protein BatD n=1 Tax=Vibrio aquaticus TaxID=2496559 RepID=A0A3S0ML69_9VIBR|nr:BatD family protein [Vibrio aquaticus]RTZ17636.1 protein BatD [Vibrio aquaticus]
MKKPTSLFFVSLCALLLALVSPFASATNIQVTVSKNKVVKNEVFQLRVVVDKKVSSDAIDFSTLDQGFYVGRPSFGTSINIMNGDRSTRSEWNISLAAQRIGITSIPAFTIDGASSNAISIEVSADTEQPNVTDLVELTSNLSKSTLYPKESATLTTRLIVKADPRRLQNPTIIPPNVLENDQNGVSLEPIGEPNQYQSILGGVEVTVVDQNYRVIANHAGSYTLSGVGFQGSVVYNGRNGTTKLISANTDAKTFPLEVHPIPSNYQGQWLPAASLILSQQWSDASGQAISSARYATQIGDSLTRIITLDVEGLTSEHIPDINIEYPEGVRLYQEKPQFSDLGNGVTRMTLKQVLIPQQQGEITLAGVSLNWWDSTNSQAQAAKLAPLTLDVAPANIVNSEPLAPVTTLTEPAQTVTVSNAGYWPYLTALFALLWIITAGLLVKSRRGQSTISTPTVVTDSSELEQIKHALKVDDKVKVSFLVKRWLSETEGLDTQLCLDIHSELAAMNESQYSSESKKWQSTKLLNLIKKANKHRHTKKGDSPLAPL